MTDWNACRTCLQAGARALDVSLSESMQARLLDYLQALSTWNATHNLTAVREPQAMVTRHLLDSLAVLPYVGDGRLVDVGSGAGLPGIVLAIARPQLDVTLVEANGKKAAFLRHARRQLALDNVQVARERVERYTPQVRFDEVICRAFASAEQVMQWVRHLLVPDGRVLMMKGRDPQAELAAVPADCHIVQTASLNVPGLDAARHLAIVKTGLI